jgi:hypothetical protein
VLRLRRSRTLASKHPLRATECVAQGSIFCANTSSATPSGTTTDDMDNKNVLNVTLDELPGQLKDLVVTAVNQYQEKCLLSFSKNRDRKVTQKTTPKGNYRRRA